MTQMYPSYVTVAEELRAVASRLNRYFTKANGDTTLERVLQAVVKPLEELEEVLFEITAVEPDLEAVAAECADIILAASTAQAKLGWSAKTSAMRIRAELATPQQRTAAAFRLAIAVGGLGTRAILWTSQNPNKVAQGKSASDEDMAAHLDQVILAAAELISAVGFGVAETMLATTQKVADRLDKWEAAAGGEPRIARPDERGSDWRTAARNHVGSLFWSAVQDRADQLGVGLADVVDERFLATMNRALYEIAEAGR